MIVIFIGPLYPFFPKIKKNKPPALRLRRLLLPNLKNSSIIPTGPILIKNLQGTSVNFFEINNLPWYSALVCYKVQDSRFDPQLFY